ncbi:MAG: hypothetical protein LBI86_06640 [Treponema sp.]|jgi:hypothetical protein|nr:hypothetical protein [Treponema sp.]
MQEPTLNDLYGSYTSNRLDKRQFEEALFKNIMRNYGRFFPYHWHQEDRTDYLCWLYPRISRAIDHYRDTGSSFEAYMGAMLRWSVREWKSHGQDFRMQDYAAWMGLTADCEEPQWAASQPLEEEVHSCEPGYPDPDRKKVPKITNPRQVLILMLKTYYCVSDDFLERAAPLVGVKKEDLGNMVEALRKRRLEREDEIRRLREHISGQLYRCIAYERKMLALIEDRTAYTRARDRLGKARERLKSMRERLSHVRLEATNLQVSEVLGVPKGTIDSSLYALWNRMGRKKRELSGRAGVPE